ncbi:hypothetical protein CHS0354_001786 [Potamilus streckersoni]|uniref:Gem-associated protein 6 n=1 Tax=Potamilus streckersoni TaxID=2493646 RepID=A0AAE0VNW4_9BIVA|nr:hypothetical protein CHS0354_001786 [Potamilus streckersoni]
MTDEESEDLHVIFKKDPEEWMQYVYKQVSITTDDERDHIGWVYTVDPVSETFVLVRFSGEKYKLELVFGHAVRTVTILNDSTETNKERLDRLFRYDTFNNLSQEELKKKQKLLKLWLCKNRIPVTVSGSNGELLTVSDALIIKPPYGPEDCCGTNEIILGRIQGLIKNMPPDHDQW